MNDEMRALIRQDADTPVTFPIRHMPARSQGVPKMDKLLARAKALVAVLIPLGAALVASVGDEHVTNVWLLVVAALTALGVYVTPNRQAPG